VRAALEVLAALGALAAPGAAKNSAPPGTPA
jgi:hypothetical protein